MQLVDFNTYGSKLAYKFYVIKLKFLLSLAPLLYYCA